MYVLKITFATKCGSAPMHEFVTLFEHTLETNG
jgi:hypothetical protein